MKQLTASRKKLMNNAVTYGIVIAAYLIIQFLNAGGMVSPSI